MDTKKPHPAIQFFAQAANDLSATLPPSARGGFLEHAQRAVNDVQAMADELAAAKDELAKMKAAAVPAEKVA